MLVKAVVSIALLIQYISAQNAAVLILARGGSKGIHLKNLSILGGISLLSRCILTARQSGIEDITVSTDHPLIALEALKNGATVLKRSYATSTDWAPSIWGVAEFLENRPDVEIIVLLQATSPFIKPKDIYLSVNKILSPVSFDCIFSVTRSYKLRWSYKQSVIYPLNFKYDKRPRRQDWSGEFVETGAFYICRRELIKKGYLQNNNCTIWEVSQAESLEIDTPFDLRLANILLQKKNDIL